MTDVYEHNPSDHEDPLTGPSWYVGLVGALLLVVTLLGLTALYYNTKTKETEEKVIAEFPIELEKLLADQEERLTGPAHREVRDEAGEQITALVIPIEDAMQLVAKELGAREGTP
jgi:hypothetical protein